MRKDLGTMPEYQQEGLIKVIGSNKVVVEIGSYRGLTSKKIAEAGNKVICIDPFICGYCENDSVSKELAGENDVKKSFLENTKELDVELIEKKSQEAIKDFNREIDVLLIDGEHSYDAIVRDIEWIKFVKPGGLICFHDYGNSKYPGVKDAIDKFILPKYSQVYKICTLIIFKK